MPSSTESSFTLFPRCKNMLNVRRQAGQGTVEFIIVLAAAVPMFFLFPLVGKYIDLMQVTEEASRYVAFEATVHVPGTAGWKDDAAIQKEVARRFYSGTGTMLVTGEGPQPVAEDHSQVWQDHRGTRFLQDLTQDVTVVRQIETFKSLHEPIDEVVEDMELPKDRFINASVTVKTHSLPDVIPFDGMNLSITRKTAVLADTWEGGDRDAAKHVVQRMTTFYPQNASFMQQLDDAVAQFSDTLGDWKLEHSMPDDAWPLLPCDRLKEGC